MMQNSPTHVSSADSAVLCCAVLCCAVLYCAVLIVWNLPAQCGANCADICPMIKSFPPIIISSHRPVSRFVLLLCCAVLLVLIVCVICRVRVRCRCRVLFLL